MKQNLKIGFLLGLMLALAMVAGACAPAAPVTSEPQAADVATEVPATEVPTEEPTSRPAPQTPNLILATTTSTQDSGLLDVLVPLFEKEYGYVVKTVAVGSGAAIAMAQEGNADVLLVHSPAAEKKFMEEGWGKERALLMHNDFIIVGPEADPSAIKGLPVVDAFKKIYADASPFVARGDESGTSTKELGIWKKAEVDPATEKAAWYNMTGQGMGASLTIASEKGAYILTDRATYLANKANLALAVLVQGDQSLLNIYHVITINTEKWPNINYQGGLDFHHFMIDPKTQAIIAQFGVDTYGEPLFFPDADKTDADFGL